MPTPTPLLALFRGINVGGRNQVPMKGLVSLMESVGLSSVRTFIQSGNVVFRTARADVPALVTEIQEAVQSRHGFRPEVLLLDTPALEKAIAGNPFPEADAAPTSVHLTFLFSIPVDPDLEALERVRGPGERFVLEDRVFYLHAPDGIGRSKLAVRIEPSLGVSGTSRNWRTVVTLREMMQRCP